MVGLRGRHERRAGRALAGLYEEHGAAVFAFAVHLCGSREDAEDVVQTAYLHAFRALAAGEQLVNPRAWLMVVVRRQVYNLWRGRKETAVADLPEAGAHDSDGEALTELRRVRMVLFSLPEAQHQAFVLRHWSGLSNREIADVLDTSESAVETLLVRARGAILATGDGAEQACTSIRERLAQGGAISKLDVEHLSRCRGCSRAKERLAKITAAAAAAALVPRAHVAQALAAAVPGFKTGTGVAAGLAAGKASAAKVAVAGLLSAGAIAVTAPAAVHALHQQFHHPAPMQPRQRVAVAADWKPVPEIHSTPGATLPAKPTSGGSSHPTDHSRTRDSNDRPSQQDQPDGGSSGDSGGDGSSQDGNSSGRSTSEDSRSSGDSQQSGGSTSQDSGGDQNSSGTSSSDGNGQ